MIFFSKIIRGEIKRWLHHPNDERKRCALMIICLLVLTSLRLIGASEHSERGGEQLVARDHERSE